MPARSRDRPPGPSADRRRLWVRPASGLVWSMNCESWLVPKHSLIDATTGRMLIRVCGVIASTSWVVIGQRALPDRQVKPELAVDLVPADLGQVVPLGVEVQVVEQRLRGLAGRRLARAQLAVDVEERVVLAGRVVLLQGGAHRLVLAEALEDAGVIPAKGLQQHGDRLLALAVDADADGVALVDLELKPRTPARDHLAGVDVLVARLVDLAVEVHTRRPDELADDDTLGAVDDEGALAGHEREVAHEHGLALDLTGGVVDELRRDEHRGGVRHVLVLALLVGV